ncbi:MAG: cell division protein CrgA [Actinomycetia bacterium]|nr:cell division protein CrgA [Actinomycetes bacterium]
MPESKKRKTTPYTPPTGKGSKTPVKIDGSRWVAPVMIALFVIGLLWIVVWYIAPDNALMGSLAGWNVAIGFVFIGAGFILSTRWR